MPWVKLDDRFSEHPKWGNAPSCDVHWFLFALCYCNRNLTDGFIPAGVAERLTPGHQQIEVEALPFRVIRRLIDLGVISEKEKRGIAGYEIHDFLDYQPSRKAVEREKVLAGERLQRFRQRKRNGIATLLQRSENGDATHAPDPDPDPTEKNRSKHVPAVAETPVEFTEFWSLYPRKDARADALKAWRQVQPKNGTVEAIHTNVKARCASGEWTLDRRQFIPLPATYLRGRRWEDQGTPGVPAQRAVISSKTMELAREHYRKIGGCPHEPKHTFAECVRVLAEAWS